MKFRDNFVVLAQTHPFRFLLVRAHLVPLDKAGQSVVIRPPHPVWVLVGSQLMRVPYSNITAVGGDGPMKR